MPLVVETGAGLADAESYRSAADTAAYFAARGITAAEAEWEPLLLRAMDALEARRWAGTRATTGQALSFPRTGITDPDGVAYADGIVPRALGEAQMWLAEYIRRGSDPGAVAGPAIRSEKIAELEIAYAVSTTQTTDTALSLAGLPNVHARIAHLLHQDDAAEPVDPDAPGRVYFGRTVRA